MFGWVGRKENKWWSLVVFSLGPPKTFLPKIERILGRENSWNELPKILLEFTSKSQTYFFFLFLLKCPSIHIFFFLNVYDVLLFVLFNRDMMVNLYKIYFHTKKKKCFPSFHFSTLPTKHKWGKIKSFLSSHFFILSPFFILPLFHPSN